MTNQDGCAIPVTQRPVPNVGATHDYRIHLNFLPVDGDLPSFVVHRRLQASPQEPRPSDAIMRYRLPSCPEDAENWPYYWVSFEPAQGFEPFETKPRLNRQLACRMLFWSLQASASRILPAKDYQIPKNAFIQEIAFIQQSHQEGDELFVVQPYYLKVTQQFGYLLDFHFRQREGIPYSRKIQQLSLSLDHNWRRNIDYYADRTTRVSAFAKDRQDVLQALPVPGKEGKIELLDDLVALPANRLQTKVYVFADGHESKSQFTGLRDYGPLKPLDGPPRLLFIFREQDREAARKLALVLRGTAEKQPFSFAGFRTLFKSDLQIDHNPVVLRDLTQATIEDALTRVKSESTQQSNTVPVLVLPNDDDSYLVQKALFTQAGIATQVCTLGILQDEDTFKWAIANLALQIFCKAGGHPWKVRPTIANSLIIGISQSHKIREESGVRRIEKYFAFSVMTDNSGLFQKIQVLGEDQNEGDYLAKLRQSLLQVLNESAQKFSQVIVHTSFKLKYSEIDAIQSTVQNAAATPDLAKCRFAVVKVNHKSRFFGTNRRVNSLVPYEATCLKLGPGEYLVWFEGIFPDRLTVTKAYPGPTHLEILRASGERGIPDEVLLQDLVNLSGANWRGFNAKSAPVSVFYCHLVADLVQNFHERGLPLPAVQNMRPWFL